MSTNILTEGLLFDEGNLLIGSIDGLNIFNVNTATSKNNNLAETQITGLIINNKEIKQGQKLNNRILLKFTMPYTDKLVLKHNENNISFRISALHYSNPHQNRFRYMLEGNDNTWKETNDESDLLTFTNLSPGNYKLKLLTSNNDGVWNTEPKTLKIRIKPPFWSTTIAYVFYLLLLGLILFLIDKNIKRKEAMKNKTMLDNFEKNKQIAIAEAKLKYHSNIIHDLRTPLSLILAPTTELLEKEKEDKFLNSRLTTIKNNAKRLLELVDRSIDYKKINENNYNLKIRKKNLKAILEDIHESFQVYAKNKHINITLSYNIDIEECWFDSDIINELCYNLLSNAINFTNNNGQIDIIVDYQNKQKDRIKIAVKDNGIGIREEDLEKIFNRFYQVTDSLGGSGIGLDICKNLMNIHHGNIWVESTYGKGSVFTFEFPINLDGLIIEPSVIEDIEIEEEWFGENNLEDNSKPIILIIEDNNELSEYLSEILSEIANVVVANNGAEGLKKAIEVIPDIIICDIMMPKMDGIEFTKKSKQNINTSHIPIILLSAKTTTESQLEGLASGADDYIIKPFTPSILILKIQNLIRLTNSRKEVGVEKHNQKEMDFINKFESIILNNLSNPEFSMEMISEELGMSRMQLYRKITSLLDKKPSQYIKELKMKKAYELIKMKGLNISETMFELGYTNFTHFSKLFFEINGMYPRDLMGLEEND